MADASKPNNKLTTILLKAKGLLFVHYPVEDWGKLLGDSTAATATLDRLLHHGSVLKCGPRSWLPGQFPGWELHPLKSSAFHGPLFRQFTATMAQPGRLVTWSIGAPRGTHPLSRWREPD